MCPWPVKADEEPGEVTLRISEVLYGKYFRTGKKH